MIEPLFIRWRQIVRAATGQGRAHGREPYGGPSRSDRPDAPGEPGSTPLGTDDEVGRHPDLDGGVAPLDGRKGPPG